ncbi:mandelate racemase/muconate lactonizing enzyme family protein [Haladaptatus sp. GCM10025893]|uniref:mandelate racemase/muconate lactonizing enzyme family protein n=1 Tax=Haladaptatus sp. GCM10025893 TaxID=3252659 RepID=UPI003613BBEA
MAGKYTGSGTIGQSAITAIETACWDIKGKILGVPVYELLGGKFRDEIGVYSDTQATAKEEGSSEEFTPEAFARAARDVVNQGFESIKFDLDVMTPGHPNDDTAARRMDDREIQHKAELVRAVRDEIGYEVDLGMDLHWKYTVETAVRLGRELEEFNLSFLEDPVHPEKLDAQARVREQIDIPILTGENVVTVNRFADLLKHDTLDLAAPDVTECGGLSVLRKIAAVCDLYGVPMAPHNLASPVGTIAGVHFAASIPNFYSLEYRGGDAPWWDGTVVRTGESGPILSEGSISLPEGPGLGIEVNPDVVLDRLTEESEYIF